MKTLIRALLVVVPVLMLAAVCWAAANGLPLPERVDCPVMALVVMLGYACVIGAGAIWRAATGGRAKC